jgi:hypothetical protein
MRGFFGGGDSPDSALRFDIVHKISQSLRDSRVNSGKTQDSGRVGMIAPKVGNSDRSPADSHDPATGSIFGDRPPG